MFWGVEITVKASGLTGSRAENRRKTDQRFHILSVALSPQQAAAIPTGSMFNFLGVVWSLT